MQGRQHAPGSRKHQYRIKAVTALRCACHLHPRAHTQELESGKSSNKTAVTFSYFPPFVFGGTPRFRFRFRRSSVPVARSPQRAARSSARANATPVWCPLQCTRFMGVAVAEVQAGLGSRPNGRPRNPWHARCCAGMSVKGKPCTRGVDRCTYTLQPFLLSCCNKGCPSRGPWASSLKRVLFDLVFHQVITILSGWQLAGNVSFYAGEEGGRLCNNSSVISYAVRLNIRLNIRQRSPNNGEARRRQSTAEDMMTGFRWLSGSQPGARRYRCSSCSLGDYSRSSFSLLKVEVKVRSFKSQRGAVVYLLGVQAAKTNHGSAVYLQVILETLTQN